MMRLFVEVLDAPQGPSTSVVLNGGSSLPRGRFCDQRGLLESSQAMQYAGCNASFRGNFCI